MVTLKDLVTEMEAPYIYEYNIYAAKNALPIYFVHNGTVGDMDNHVLHMHESMELYFFIAGDHKYVVDNTIYDLSYGDIIIINPGEIHKVLPLSETAYERFFFRIDCNLFENMHFDPLAELLNRPDGVGNLLVLDKKDKDEVISMLYEISSYIRGEEQNVQFRVYSLIMRILDIIVRNKSQIQDYTGSADCRKPELVERILEYISENVRNIESVTKISDALGKTPQYISSYFSKYMGIPLKSYIQIKKIALAKSMLIAGSNVTETCFACGFNDCSYFIRIFSKYAGMTPAAYRRMNCNT